MIHEKSSCYAGWISFFYKFFYKNIGFLKALFCDFVFPPGLQGLFF